MSLPALINELEHRRMTVEALPRGQIRITPSKALTAGLRQQLLRDKTALHTYVLARCLALEAERNGIDLVDYVGATAPDLLEIDQLREAEIDRLTAADAAQPDDVDEVLLTGAAQPTTAEQHP
jgi:hypothetical protein